MQMDTKNGERIGTPLKQQLANNNKSEFACGTNVPVNWPAPPLPAFMSRNGYPFPNPGPWIPFAPIPNCVQPSAQQQQTNAKSDQHDLNVCRYHKKFGFLAQNCLPNCIYYYSANNYPAYYLPVVSYPQQQYIHPFVNFNPAYPYMVPPEMRPIASLFPMNPYGQFLVPPYCPQTVQQYHPTPLNQEPKHHGHYDV